jgi:hypothetical protein
VVEDFSKAIPFSSSIPLFSWFNRLMNTILAIPRYISVLCHWVASIIYMITIAITGFVIINLLTKFAHMTYERANIEGEQAPEINEEESTCKQQNIYNAALQRKEPKNEACEALLTFMRTANFSRKGRRSRSPASKKPKHGYNVECYDPLSVDDVKMIGVFLGIPGLSAIKAKNDLIDAVVLQYEAYLQSLSVSDLKKVIKVGGVKSTKNADLIKIAVETGF